MRLHRSMGVAAGFALSALVLSLVFAGCGEGGKSPRGKNLLKNGSFEEAANGVPAGWEIGAFRGLETDIPAEWGVDGQVASEGKQSFFFQATPEARRFFVLTQSVELEGVTRLRVRGAVRTLDIRRGQAQYPQSNFALTFYDKNGNRFESTRFYDLKTQAHTGTSLDWIVEDRIFRVPDNTARVEFHCALGMEGKMWYDNVSLGLGENVSREWLSNAFQVTEVAVMPVYQRQRIGGTLLDALLEGLAFERAVLSTLDTETPGRAMYRARGWQDLLHGFYFPGVSRRYAIMGRLLDQKRL